MPTVLNGYVINRSVRDPRIPTELVIFSIAAGTTKTISFPEQAGGIAISMQLENQDGANAATYRINGISSVDQNLGASQFRGVNEIPISMVRIVAGAAGAVIVRAEIVRFADLQ